MTERLDIETTRALARKIRRHVVEMTHRAKASHVGTSLSMADCSPCSTAACCASIRRARVARARPLHAEQGARSAGLYAVLAERGFFPPVGSTSSTRTGAGWLAT